MNNNREVSPVNPLPPSVIAIFAAMFLVEMALSLGARGLIGGPMAVGWRSTAIQNYGFFGDILSWMWQTGRWLPEYLIRFVTYPFVHASFTHMLIAAVIFLAMGKMVAESFGNLALVAIFVLSGVGGALATALILDNNIPLIGAFPPAYGLIGAYTFMLWQSLITVGARQIQAFQLIAVLMGLQLVFMMFFGAHTDLVADAAGFATGFCLSFVLAPGGWARLQQRMRRD